MAKARKKSALALIQEWLDSVLPIFRLEHWQIRLEGVPTDGIAETIFDAPYRARMRFGPEFWKLSHEDQKKTLLHELAHVLLYRYDQFVATLIEGHGGQLKPTLERLHEIEGEYMAELLEVAFAPLVPELTL